MSERNGDKARFGRQRKRKISLRRRVREFRRDFENQDSRPAYGAAPGKEPGIGAEGGRAVSS
jgi:hypothetical protein